MAAIGAAFAAGASGSAEAQTRDFDRARDFVVSISPSEAGSKTKPKPTRLNFQISNAIAAPGARIRLFHPRPILVSGRGLAKCAQSKLATVRPERCPPASRVGEGTADVVQDVSGTLSVVPFDVIAFMRTTRSIGFMFRSTSRQASINKLAVAQFNSPPNIGFGFATFLDLPVPAFGGASPKGFTGLVGLKMSLYKRVRQRSLYRTTGCTSRGRLRFGLTMPMATTRATGEKSFGTGRALANAACNGRPAAPEEEDPMGR